MRSDSELQYAVEAELRCHPDVDDSGIVVTVKDGVVGLSGYARNIFDKYGAADAVKRVAGVAAVADDIGLNRNVRLGLTNAKIAREAVYALHRTLPLYRERICPLVCERTITLEGTVYCRQHRDVAAAAVRHLEQVAGVVNDIMIARDAISDERLGVARHQGKRRVSYG